MREINFSADDLVKALVNLPNEQGACLLDSGGVSNLGSRYLIAGFDAVEILEINAADAGESLKILDEKISSENLFGILTISYEFGLKLNNLKPRPKEFSAFDEPDVFLAVFDCLIVHDYETRKSFLTGNQTKFDEIEKVLIESLNSADSTKSEYPANSPAFSNFTPAEYCRTVEHIQEFIRRGDTYQTNLTQQIRVPLPEGFSPEQGFLNLRRTHPAPFAAFLRRPKNVVISASPERFFKVESPHVIQTSPIKGTRPRGQTLEDDHRLREELLTSEKDLAENVMIVDLLRNDLGRICEFGSVAVEKLCDLETHPTLFHLVSTVRGELRDGVKLSDILKAVFPCGSITGAPKISTMQIIDRLETAPRGLSMGAIGFLVQSSKFRVQSSESDTHHSPFSTHHYFDLSVAIRTAVIENNEAIFNVGGGIVIDSVPADEYAETLTKATVLLKIFNAEIKF